MQPVFLEEIIIITSHQSPNHYSRY